MGSATSSIGDLILDTVTIKIMIFITFSFSNHTHYFSLSNKLQSLFVININNLISNNQ